MPKIIEQPTGAPVGFEWYVSPEKAISHATQMLRKERYGTVFQVRDGSTPIADIEMQPEGGLTKLVVRRHWPREEVTETLM